MTDAAVAPGASTSPSAHRAGDSRRRASDSYKFLAGSRATVFVRFVTSDRDSRSDQQVGIFTALYRLEREGKLAAYELEWFRALEDWFDAHLKKPDRLAWSSRPNAPTRAITWLKMSSAEHVSRMRELMTLLDQKDVAVEELRTDKPGYIVYEDEHQVAAVPFGRETFE